MLENKEFLRQKFRRERRQTSCAEKREIDEAVVQRVLNSPEYQRSNTVFLYVATAEEIDTRAILQHALQNGKCVCVPRCGAHQQMTAHRINSLDELRETGSFGILEPAKETPLVRPDEIDFIVTPALACDQTGVRLGYGGGYYDRYLAQTTAHAAVLCAEKRLIDALPCDNYDQRCDLIFTERRVLRIYEK
ncbi:5-formyltetrahydrofolate cyclo-ligase [Agathobaculum sp.]|uniref:5-formyltetrahydrofolate cyclo-ligase n=1 Tax=Agathobaculum sp. TaxID=2048138 RepID=UPI002A7FE2FE|nr:5-formyltetrahydrofolate cyclo-ligase [Agathobaculum sp.]MDY3618883.1 5-formyltetrahydrofolate cyclo-ligase [Agathobaculum sp.]